MTLLFTRIAQTLMTQRFPFDAQSKDGDVNGTSDRQHGSRGVCSEKKRSQDGGGIPGFGSPAQTPALALYT